MEMDFKEFTITERFFKGEISKKIESILRKINKKKFSLSNEECRIKIQV